MAIDRQRLPLQRNLADAFAAVIGHAFGHTPKGVAKEVAIDPRAARNALEGKAGTPIITQTLLNRQRSNDDHYDLALGVLALIFGETLDEYEERKLQRFIESTHNATRLVEARRQRRGELRALTDSDTRHLDQRRA